MVIYWFWLFCWRAIKSFQLGTNGFNLQIIKLGIDAGGLMFKFGALIMLPVVVAITLLNVVIGVVTRSAPSLSLFFFWFPNYYDGSVYFIISIAQIQ